MEETIYVGNYSDTGIEIYNFIDKNNLKKVKDVKGLKNNSYICLNDDYLYSISELYEGGHIIAYKIENKDLKLINYKNSKGRSPCHLIVDKSRKIIFIAHYGDGVLSAYKINSDGSIGQELFYKKFSNKSHLHNIQISKDNQNLYLIDLGTDTVFKYKIDYNNENLDLQLIDKIVFEKETEPRHLAIDCYNNIFVISEKACKLFKIKQDINGKMKIINEINILTNKNENDTGCAIKIDSKGNFLYISMRGCNNIYVFDIRNNNLKLLQNIYCEGKSPRDIAFDSEEKNLFVANQESNEICLFGIEYGKLYFKAKYKSNKPSCIVAKKG